MTLIVGLRCSDGVILAADSASTDSQVPIKTEASDKIFQIGDYPVLCGASGNVGVVQDIQESLQRSFKMKERRNDVRRNLVGLVRPILDSAIKNHVAPTAGPPPPNATILSVGVVADGPFLLEISPNCETTWYHDQQGNFYTIGSAKGLALALFRRFWSTEPYEMKLGRLLVYRVVRDSIHLAASQLGLSEPVHLFEIEAPDGRVRRLAREDISRLDANCDFWRELESETLGRLAGLASDAESKLDKEPPLPPTPSGNRVVKRTEEGAGM